jgi:hypothetical protein
MSNSPIAVVIMILTFHTICLSRHHSPTLASEDVPSLYRSMYPSADTCPRQMGCRVPQLFVVPRQKKFHAPIEDTHKGIRVLTSNIQ